MSKTNRVNTKLSKESYDMVNNIQSKIGEVFDLFSHLESFQATQCKIKLEEALMWASNMILYIELERENENYTE